MWWHAPRSRSRSRSDVLRSLWPFTARGTLVLAVGAVALAAGAALATTVLIFTGVALVAVVLFCVLSLWLRPVARDVVRTVSATVVPAGTEVDARISVEVGPGRVARYRWADALAREGVRRTGELEPAPDGVARAAYSFVPTHRGEHAFGPLHITATDVLGLACRRQPYAVVSTLVVGPAVTSLASADLVDVAGAGGRSSMTYAGDGTDDLVPRPYVRGDSRRRVHWKATAHRGELMVRQEEHESAPTASVVVDRHARDDDTLEAVLAATASVAVHLAETGFSVDVIDTDGSTHVTRLGIDATDLVSALAHCTRRAADDHLAGGRAARPSDGPIVVVAADEAARVTQRLDAAAPGRSVIAILTTSPDGIDARRPVGDLRRGVASAWREAVIRDRV